MERWACRNWFAGADGVVPWQSVGTDANFATAEATALLLPGKRFGINGPVASLRLKALRRAQQDVEYLVLFAKATGMTREQIAVDLGFLDASPNPALGRSRWLVDEFGTEDFTGQWQGIAHRLADSAADAATEKPPERTQP